MREGLTETEYYFPEKDSWGQAHCHARHVLLRVCIEAGQGFISIDELTNPVDGKPDLLFRIDRSKIDSVGKVAISEFLKKLQNYKSTGSLKGKTMFENYAKMDEKWLEWRKIVIDRRQPQKLFVQPNTSIDDGKVVITEYPVTAEGVIQSVIQRYPDSTVCDDLMMLHNKDKHHFE